MASAPIKVTVLTGAAIAVVAGTLFWLAVRSGSPAPPQPAGATRTRVDDPTPATGASARANSPTNDLKALAAAVVAQPPTREEFAAILAQLGRGRLQSLFRELGRQNFSLALKLAEFTDSAHIAKARAVWGCAEVDPDQALEWALANPYKGGESTTANFHLQNWAAGAFGTQREVLYAFIDRFPPNQAILSARHDAIAGIEHRANVLRAYRELFDDPRAPALIVSLRSDPRVTGGTADARLLGLAGGWARHDPQALLEYAARATDPLTRRPLLVGAVGAYVELNPSEALGWSIRMDPDHSLGVVNSGINEWLNRSATDLEAPLRWAKSDPSRQPHVDLVAGQVAARIGDKDFQRAYEIAFTITDASTRQKALETVALYNRKDDAHFDYVKRSGNLELLAASIVPLAAKQPDRANELLTLMPAGPLKTATEERVRVARKTAGN